MGIAPSRVSSGMGATCSKEGESPGNQPSQSTVCCPRPTTPTPGGVVLPFLGEGLIPSKGEWNTARQCIFQTRLVLRRRFPPRGSPSYSPRVCGSDHVLNALFTS